MACLFCVERHYRKFEKIYPDSYAIGRMDMIAIVGHSYIRKKPDLAEAFDGVQFYGIPGAKAVMNQRQKEATELALQHFDMFYKPVYRNLWPKLRQSLLSNNKYCALMNNFGDGDEAKEMLIYRGAYNIINAAASSYEKRTPKFTNNFQSSLPDSYSTGSDKDDEDLCNEHGSCEMIEKKECFKSEKTSHDVDKDSMDRIEDIENVADKSHFSKTSEKLDLNFDYDEKYRDLYSFVPTTAVYSSAELLQREIIEKSTFSQDDIPIPVIPSPRIVFPEKLQAYAFPKRDQTDFPPAQANSIDILSYYLMDASSLLPVIALDIQYGDTVLDLCAAPGGKSLAILQMLKIKELTCNDLSGSRLRRLERVLECYLGPDIKSENNIKITCKNGMHFKEPVYDKSVTGSGLYNEADVWFERPLYSSFDYPSTHLAVHPFVHWHLHVQTVNLLMLTRGVGYHQRIPYLEPHFAVDRELISRHMAWYFARAGLKSCQPGGSVVYSTCTLSPGQNDGVIQNVFQHILQESSMEVEVHDLTSLTKAFSDTFKFFKCRFGHLALPTMKSNFGPTYFCKLKRIK